MKTTVRWCVFIDCIVLNMFVDKVALVNIEDLWMKQGKKKKAKKKKRKYWSKRRKLLKKHKKLENIEKQKKKENA